LCEVQAPSGERGAAGVAVWSWVARALGLPMLIAELIFRFKTQTSKSGKDPKGK
jgi:hypothetical protein